MLALEHAASIGRSLRGSFKDYELHCEMAGLLGFEQGREAGREGTPSVQAGVVFMGLPKPPTPEEAERLRPPPGSAMIITPARVLENRSWKERKP